MTEVIASQEGKALVKPEARKAFAAPLVEDLGQLQALTQLQITVPLPP